MPNHIASIGTSSNGSIATSIYTNGNITFHHKIFPKFKMEMYKSENGGFVMNLISYQDNTNNEESKLFILSDIENLGKDIQNILLTEILKK